MPTPPTPDLPALRAAARAYLAFANNAPTPSIWRVISIDCGGGVSPVIGPVCPSAASHPALAESEPTDRDVLGVYDCCPHPQLEVWSPALAAFLVALLNTDAARDTAVRTAAFTEAADWLVRKYGVTNRAAGDLYRLAAAPTATTTPTEH